MKSEYAPFRILTRPLRWLMWSWCVCFLSMSLMAPVSATLMIGSGEVDSTAHSMNHRASSSDSHATSHAGHHHGAKASHCDSCAQDKNCLSICLHCSVCHFSALSTPVVPPFNAPKRVSEKLRLTRATALPNRHTSPPYRPPIARF